MLRVMVVDDEAIILKGIKSIIKRRAQDYVLVGEARSVEDAVKTAISCRPDVIITDIRMPDGTGLQMIERLRRELADTKYVVLSGYGEFEYAQDALRLGVFDYILKPVNSRGIYAVLEKITSQFQEKKQTLSEKKAEKIREDLYQFFYRRNKKVSEQICSLLKNGFFYTIVVLQFPDACDDEDRQQGLQMTELYLQKNQAGFVTANDNEICMLIQTEKVSDVHFINRFLLEQMHGLKLQGSRLFVSDTMADQENIQELFWQAKQCQGMAFYRVDDLSIQRWSGEKLLPFTIDMIRSDLPSELCALLEQKDIGKAEERFRGQIAWCAEKMIFPQDAARYFQGIFRLIIARMMSDGFLPPVLDEVLNEQIFNVNECNSSEELFGRIKTILQELTKGNKMANHAGASRIVNEVKRYIREHYAENISLNALANQVFLSPKYLSDLFKKETGENYTKYLVYVRMEHAKKYLLQMDLKIYEVAEMVGYVSPKQFIKVFKKEVGITPGEYRNQPEKGK